MLRNYLAAALRNLARDRLYAGLNIVGLGIGFAAAILVALYVRHELNFEHFIPGYQDVYRLSSEIAGSGTGSSTTDDVRGPIVDELKLDFHQILAIALLRNNFGKDLLRRGDVESVEPGFYFADPQVFEVLPLPVAAGDLRTALQRPDGLVLTRRMARKYFGTDLPLGQTIEIDRQYTMRVTAVLEDLPSNTHLNAEVFASTRALPPLPQGFVYRCYVYMRLASAAAAQQIRAGMPAFVDRHSPPSQQGKASGILGLALVSIGDIHLRPPGRFAMKPAGDRLLLPQLNAFLDCNMIFNYWSPPLLAALLGLAALVGLFAGLYPALVLSAFRPATVLKGGVTQVSGSGRLRQLFVLLQFSILIGLVLATGVIQQQTQFGLRAGLRFDHDQLLSIDVPQAACERSAFTSAVQALPGVRGTACSMAFLVNYGTQQYRAADGCEITLQNTFVGPGLFEMLRLKPLAGRFFEHDNAADVMPPVPQERDLAIIYRTVINEMAARALGYTNAAAAIGQVFCSLSPLGTRREIIGVVPDFASNSVRVAISPVLYDNIAVFDQLSVKLRGSDLQQSVQAIDRLWKQTGLLPAPISRRFYDRYVEDLYRDLERQGALFSVFSAVALLLSAMGLFGLAAFTVERRTREIGVRKALGARTSQVTWLLLWQFAKPVLAANLIAWPLAAWLMSRWLRGFAYRIDLPLWLFPAAAMAALVIALINVSGHSLRVARASPVKALRYE